MHKSAKVRGRVKYTHVQYGRGANNAVEVALQTIDMLQLPPETSMDLIRLFGRVMKERLALETGINKLREDWVTRAINEALIELNKGKQNGRPEMVG